jgi:hypothetical protein
VDYRLKDERYKAQKLVQQVFMDHHLYHNWPQVILLGKALEDLEPEDKKCHKKQQEH